MNQIEIPDGFLWEPLSKRSPRRLFGSGEPAVDAWLQTQALQNQQKHLTSTQVLMSSDGRIAGFFTLAMNFADLGDLPADISKNLPNRLVPVAVLAWLGVDLQFQGQRVGRALVAQAIRMSYGAGRTFPFVAFMIDCLNESVKAYYQRWNFREAPGRPLRLLLSANELAALVE